MSVSSPRLCLIEDDPIMGESVADRFSLEGFVLDWYRTGEAALEALRSRRYSAVISDIRLPDISGDQVFKRVAEQATFVPPFIFITAFASVEQAVEILKHGATDYVTKPFDISELVKKVCLTIGHRANDARTSSESPLGVSEPMLALADTLPRIAKRARITLITGESGVGKEVLAHWLHELGGKVEAPFVAVNCGAIPETLLEAEFFGAERGAYTGADRARKGLFEQAIGGTLFLDEIGDLPHAMQVKLLRAIQEQQIRRLGSDKVVPVDLRIVCATNRDLHGLVKEGRFREDLYYRVNVVNLSIPPLRERPADVLWLARKILSSQAERLSEPTKTLSPAAQAALLAHGWPGNVRELSNRLERACVLSTEPVISERELFEDGAERAQGSSGMQSLEDFLSDAERCYIEAVLKREGGKISHSAAVLGVSRKTLWEKMKRLGIRTADPDASGPS